MDTARKIQFLHAKVNAIAESGALIPNDVPSFIRRHERYFDAIQKKQTPAPSIREIDSELDVVLRLAFREKSQADAIRHRLKTRFGFSSLSKTPEAEAKKILKRGSIKTADEADSVRSFLSEDTSNDSLGPGDALKLDGHLADWERKKPAE